MAESAASSTLEYAAAPPTIFNKSPSLLYSSIVENLFVTNPFPRPSWILSTCAFYSPLFLLQKDVEFNSPREIPIDKRRQYHTSKCYCCWCGASNLGLDSCGRAFLWEKTRQRCVSRRGRLADSDFFSTSISTLHLIAYLWAHQILTIGMGIMMIVGQSF